MGSENAATNQTSGTEMPPEMVAPLPPLSTQTSWTDLARSYALANAGNDGLRKLAEALDFLDTKAVLPQQNTIKQIIKNGWQGPQSGVAAVLQSQARALEAAEAAADAAPFGIPPTTDVASPVPNFLAAQQLNQLMLAKARMFEAQGAHDQAALEALRAVRLFSQLQGKSALSICHLIGISATTLAAEVLESILLRPGLSQQTLQTIGAALYDIDQKQVGPAEGFRTEMTMTLYMMRRMAEDANYRNKMLTDMNSTNPGTAKQLEAALADLTTYALEWKKVTDAIMAYMEKPAWERRAAGGFSAQGLTRDPVLLESTNRSYDEPLVRYDVEKTRIRFCQVLCASGLGNASLAKSIVDPFTGQPLRIENGRVWSLGPDGVDQSGTTLWNPKNGAKSAGDLVAGQTP